MSDEDGVVLLRPVTFADEKLLLDWRNDSTVRETVSNPAELIAESHHAWLARMLSDQDTYLYIAEVDGIAVGQGRIERGWKMISQKIDSCLISYSIGKEHRGKGYGIQLVTHLVRLAKEKHGYQTVVCRIKRTNVRSVVVAMKAGINAIELF